MGGPKYTSAPPTYKIGGAKAPSAPPGSYASELPCKSHAVSSSFFYKTIKQSVCSVLIWYEKKSKIDICADVTDIQINILHVCNATLCTHQLFLLLSFHRALHHFHRNNINLNTNMCVCTKSNAMPEKVFFFKAMCKNHLVIIYYLSVSGQEDLFIDISTSGPVNRYPRSNFNLTCESCFKKE